MKDEYQHEVPPKTREYTVFPGDVVRGDAQRRWKVMVVLGENDTEYFLLEDDGSIRVADRLIFRLNLFQGSYRLLDPAI
jgi:hypothetical protein